MNRIQAERDAWGDQEMDVSEYTRWVMFILAIVDISIVVLQSKSNRLIDLQPLFQQC